MESVVARALDIPCADSTALPYHQQLRRRLSHPDLWRCSCPRLPRLQLTSKRLAFSQSEVTLA